MEHNRRNIKLSSRLLIGFSVPVLAIALIAGVVYSNIHY